MLDRAFFNYSHRTIHIHTIVNRPHMDRILINHSHKVTRIHKILIIWTIVLSALWFWVWYFGRRLVWYSEAADNGACWWWFWWWSFTWYSSTNIETTTTGYTSTRVVYISYLTISKKYKIWFTKRFLYDD
jgi:hypothetical protein